MRLCAWYWRASAALAGTGIGLVAVNFYDDGNPWRLVGLTMVIVAATTANTGYVAMRSRSLDEEFDAGYRVGYRAGRRVAPLSPVTPLRPDRSGLTQFNRGVKHGRVPQAPVRAVAGHDSSA